MSKPYDYEELWDSFTNTEREAVLGSIWPGIRVTDAMHRSRWSVLPIEVKKGLADIDWEFALGRRFHAHRDVL